VAFAAEDFYNELATHHAPFIIQQEGRNPKADIFTRFDFDGDWNGSNNWKNLNSVGTINPSVYFSVQETKDHWYINYGFFFPRDYYPVCFWEICHENDFEGIRLSVRKDETKMGKVILLETFAHGGAHYEESPVFHADRNQVMIFIERQGHAIRSFRDHNIPGRYKEYTSDSYELLPLEDLWNARKEVGTGMIWKDTYDYVGERFSVTGVPAAFEGKKWGHGLANPPWAWTGGGKAKKGDWFFDPVISICRGYKCLDDEKTDYIYNPYILSNF
jgi:hypothetical protein